MPGLYRRPSGDARKGSVRRQAWLQLLRNPEPHGPASRSTSLGATSYRWRTPWPTHHNPPPSDRCTTDCIPWSTAHHRADGLAGLSIWIFFDHGAYVGLTLAMITVFFVIAVGIPILIWKTWQHNAPAEPKPASRRNRSPRGRRKASPPGPARSRPRGRDANSAADRGGVNRDVRVRPGVLSGRAARRLLHRATAPRPAPRRAPP